MADGEYSVEDEHGQERAAEAVLQPGGNGLEAGLHRGWMKKMTT